VYVTLGRAAPAPRSTEESPGPVRPMALDRIHDTTAREFRCTCRVYVTTLSGHSIGSGVLIGPRHVLTCAHVIFPLQDQLVKSITVHVAPNGPGAMGKGIAANGWAVSPAWRRQDCRTMDEDVGVIRLSTAVTTAFWPVSAFDPRRLAGAAAELSGYPSRAHDRDAHFMYRSRGRIIGTIRIDACAGVQRPRSQLTRTLLRPIEDTTRLVAHALDSATSMSGGPLSSYIDGRRTLWGIHAGDIDNGARKKGILLNSAVRARIAAWMTREATTAG